MCAGISFGNGGADDRGTKPHETLACVRDCEWLREAPEEVKRRFENELRGVDKLRPGFLDFLMEHRYLERYSGVWKSSVLNLGGWDVPLAYDFPFRCAVDASNAVSVALVVQDIFFQEGIDVRTVSNLLTLGCGYWSYARALYCALPYLKHAVGVDNDPGKLRGFEEATRPVHQLPADIFRVSECDLRRITPNVFLPHPSIESKRFGLVLWHNPEMPHARVWDAQAVCNSVKECIASHGKFIVCVDSERRYADGNDALFDLLRLANIQPNFYQNYRVPSGTGRHCLERRQVLSVVLTRNDLERISQVRFGL